MRKLLFLVSISSVFLFSGCKPDEPIKEVKNSNTMEVSIENSDVYNITGEIVYLSTNDLDELYVMMFPNTHVEGNDRVTINELSVDGEQVSHGFEGSDNSAVHITLNKPIKDGDTVVIQYDMDVDYPDTFRLVHRGDILYQMYLYPFVAMYDGEFDIDPFTSHGETYYNVLSDYDVTINIGEDFVVSAPGENMGSETSDGMTKHRYVLENARDFSFSAATYYRTYFWEEDGMEFEIYSTRILYPEILAQTKEYVRKSFEVYESYIGEYYYDRFVLELGDIYGMESSGIVYCSNDVSEGTIVHEIIHQWFFFMVGNDSYNDSFLDESITTYITALYYYDLYGMDGYNGHLDYRDSSKESLIDRWATYEGFSLLDNVDEMGDGYGFIIYYHGPSLFREYVSQFLNNDVEEFARILSLYYDEYNGEIASVDEFLTLLEEESGVDVTKEWFYFHLNSLQEVTNTP